MKCCDDFAHDTVGARPTRCHPLHHGIQLRAAVRGVCVAKIEQITQVTSMQVLLTLGVEADSLAPSMVGRYDQLTINCTSDDSSQKFIPIHNVPVSKRKS